MRRLTRTLLTAVTLLSVGSPASAEAPAVLRVTCSTTKTDTTVRSICTNHGDQPVELQLVVRCSVPPDYFGPWIPVPPQGTAELAGRCVHGKILTIWLRERTCGDVLTMDRPQANTPVEPP